MKSRRGEREGGSGQKTGVSIKTQTENAELESPKKGYIWDEGNHGH